MRIERKQSALEHADRRLAAVTAIAVLLVLTCGAATAGASTTPLFYDSAGNVGAGPNPFAHLQTLGGLYFASDNTAVGPSMMPALDSGSENVAAGTAALESAEDSCCNVAVGVEALTAFTGGDTVAIGHHALRSDVASGLGSDMTAVGGSALASNTTGHNNLAVGSFALLRNSTGWGNLAIGKNALTNNTTGVQNMAVGDHALESNTGDYNVAQGFEAMFSNTTGNFNTATGTNALHFNSTADGNAAFGVNALYSNTDQDDNTAVGSEALYSNTGGSGNTATGRSALRANTSGNRNVADGWQALRSNTTGIANVASGQLALFSNTTGSHNAALGSDAMFANATGHDNLAGGALSLFSNSSGSQNVALGSGALLRAKGNRNVAIGVDAGHKLAGGNNNIYLSTQGVAGDSGTTRIGTDGTQVKAFMAGVDGVSIPGPASTVRVNASGQLGTATSSSRDLKRDIRPVDGRGVLGLDPVSYRYRGNVRGATQRRQYGLIAEDVAKRMPALAQLDSHGKPQGVYYDELSVLLLAQVKKQQRQIAALRREVRH